MLAPDLFLAITNMLRKRPPLLAILYLLRTPNIWTGTKISRLKILTNKQLCTGENGSQNQVETFQFENSQCRANSHRHEVVREGRTMV